MTSLNRDLSTSPTALLSLRAMNLSSSASTSPSATRGEGGSGGVGVEREMSPGRSSGGGGTPNVVTTSSFIKVERPLSPLDASGVIGPGVVGGVGGGVTISSSSGVVSSLDGDGSAIVTLGVGGPVLSATSATVAAAWGDNSSGTSSRLSASEMEDYTLIGDFHSISGDPSSNLQDDFQQQYDSSSPGGYSSPAESLEMKPSTDADDCFLQMLDPGTLNLSAENQLRDETRMLDTGISRFEEDSDNFLREGDRRMCLVCGDVASGFHYGVASCEACKAFFKRTIQGNIDYSCPAHGECEITKRRRKACQACRFQKCLRMGMLKEGVRVDRVRGGRQKYKRRASDSPSPRPHFLGINSGTSSGSSSRPSSTSSTPTLSITCPSRHINSKPSSPSSTSTELVVFSSRDESALILMALRGAEPDKVLALPDPSFTQAADADEMKLKLIAILCDLSDRELVGTIGWAKQVPGFAHLSLSDQMNLLHGCWLEILLLAVAQRSAIGGRTSLNDQIKLIFADDFHLSEEDSESIFQSVPDLDRLLRDLVHRFRDLAVSRDEFLLLKAVVLFNCLPKLSDSAKVVDTRDVMFGHLAEYLKTGNTPVAATKRVGSLTLILPQLRQVAMLLRWFWIEVRNDGSVPMHKLFLEMLEINPNASNSHAANPTNGKIV